jgi:hypothetical protein
MKKIIILLSILTLPLATFGAIQIVKEIKSYENVAVIQTDDGKNLKVYKFEDVNKKATTTCYITYFSGWTNGNQTGISCVK